MNDVERLKQEKDGLEVYNDLERFAQEGFSSIGPDDMLRLRWCGLYQQKPNEGHFMLRVKVPGGELNVAQLRAMADITKIHARGITDITTRQNFQFHWITPETIPDTLRRLDEVGLTSAGACGDIFRNPTGCPVAGIDPHEIFDARPEVRQLHEYFHMNREFSDLPRKYKTAISGCAVHCSQPEINDIGATAVRRERANGEWEEGYQVRVGGGLSTRPHFALKMNMFVPREKLWDIFRAVTVVYRDFGHRENRKKARMKFLLMDWGIERFEEEVRKNLDWTPDPGVDWPDPVKNFQDHIGVHPQRQDGLFWIGAAVLTGRMTDEQVTAAANIAEKYGNGTLRTTNQQNLLFPNIPQSKIEDAQRALLDGGLTFQASTFRRAAVSCTGSEFCNLAITETKKLLIDIVDHLEQTVSLDEALRINLNGCPNSCGQQHIGDIGLQGCLVKTPGAATVEGYDISLGGRLGRNSKFVRPIHRKVPATQIKFALEHLLKGYIELRDEDDDFGDFVDRHTDVELADLMKTAFAEGVSSEPVVAGSEGAVEL